MKIFIFFKKVFFIGLTILSNFTNVIPLNAIPLNCISMKNQECKTRPQVVNVNSNNPIFYPFSIKMSRWKWFRWKQRSFKKIWRSLGGY